MLKTRLFLLGAAGRGRKVPPGDAMDNSETVIGKRERAAAGGALDSDIPNQTQGKRCRVGDLHLAFVADKAVVEGHALLWRRR